MNIPQERDFEKAFYASITTQDNEQGVYAPEMYDYLAKQGFEISANVRRACTEFLEKKVAAGELRYDGAGSYALIAKLVESSTDEKPKVVKFLIETGSESHTTSWQKCQAKFVGGSADGKFLYQYKQAIVSQEWVAQDRHQTVVRTVYNLPEGTGILIDYKGYEGPEKFIIRLDSAKEVKEQEIGTSRLRTYTMKGRYHLVRDLAKSAEDSLKASQEEGF